MNMSTIDFILTCMIYKISRTIWWNWTVNIWGKRCSYFCKIGESDNFRREGLVPAFSSYTLSKKKKTPQTNTNLDQTNTSHLHYRTRSSLSLSSLKPSPHTRTYTRAATMRGGGLLLSVTRRLSRHFATDSASLKKTPLFDFHVANGGKMVPFAGWSMPIQYADSIMDSTLNCRAQGSLFDVSHMCGLSLKGRDAVPFLETLVIADVAGLKPGNYYQMFFF